jgi:hypothetical protein
METYKLDDKIIIFVVWEMMGFSICIFTTNLTNVKQDFQVELYLKAQRQIQWIVFDLHTHIMTSYSGMPR